MDACVPSEYASGRKETINRIVYRIDEGKMNKIDANWE